MNLSRERAAIRAVALDYIQGWYEADPVRMEQALHPDLAKRRLNGDTLQSVIAAALVDQTGKGGGKERPGEKKCRITIQDFAGNIAAAKIISDQFIDYLHLGKVNGEWRIINVLWAMRGM